MSLNLKRYNDKIPSSIKIAMEQFTGNNCFLVPRDIAKSKGMNSQGNCHSNVASFIQANSGTYQRGWLLARNRKLISMGIYVWTFHTVWISNESKVLDITDDENYKDVPYSTVWFDDIRGPDLVNGVNYNNVIIYETEAIAAMFSSVIGKTINAGELYWTTSKMNRVLPISEHNGQYRWIDDKWSNNRLLIEQQYDCRIEGGRLVGKSANELDESIFFNFGISE